MKLPSIQTTVMPQHILILEASIREFPLARQILQAFVQPSC